MASDKHITFYDIASAPPLRTFAPNPWKTRYALNFKGAAYKTQWVEMPDITRVREELGVRANRTLPDGTPFHTLPVIHDTASGQIVGDSFEIAVYLDRILPNAPRLLPPATAGLTAAFNAHVDALFTKNLAVCEQPPFDPRIQDTVKAIFAKRFGFASAADMPKVDEAARPGLLAAFERALDELVKAYRHTGGSTDHLWREGGTAAPQAQNSAKQGAPGPFLEGDEPIYADFIVGAWLALLAETMRPEEWRLLRSWQDGFWGRLHDGLGKWREIQ